MPRRTRPARWDPTLDLCFASNDTVSLLRRGPEAYNALTQLQGDLKTVIAKDASATIEGAALDAVEALIRAAGALVAGHPIVDALVGKLPFSKLPAKDALVIVGQVKSAIPPPPIRVI